MTMSVLIKGGRDRHGGRRLRRRRLRRGRAHLADRRVARRRRRPCHRRDRASYVLPGCVDPHTHLDMPFGGTVTIDDVTSGQTAAAFGGTTCHVDFCIQTPGQLVRRRARRVAREARGQGDHRHTASTSPSPTCEEGGSLEELARLPGAGRHLVQALHGLQGRAHGRRRDALPHDGGRAPRPARS